MRTLIHSRYTRGLGLAVAFLAPACLCSCGDDAQEASASAQPAATQAPAKPATCPARDALFDELLNNISPLVTNHALVPEFNEETKILLEKMQAYYDELAAAPVSAERVVIARRIADVTRSLGAYAKARAAYDRTQADFDALPEAERQSLVGRRLQSSIWGGIGLCLLSQNKASEALPFYEKTLEGDLAILRSLGAEEGKPLPEGEVSADLARALADVVGSYRCLGDCLIWSDDPEEGRMTYQRGLDLITELHVTAPVASVAEVVLALAKLHSSLGDLENQNGREREALSSWVAASQNCRNILNEGVPASLRVEAARNINKLQPLIKEKSEKLQREAQDAESARLAEEAAAEAQPAPEAIETVAGDTAPLNSTPEPEAEPEPQAAPEPAKAEAPSSEAEKQKARKNRRNRH